MMRRPAGNVPWFHRYPHLSVLICMSTNLPRELQEHLGDCMVQTVKRYVYLLRNYGGFRKVEASYMWHYYLSLKQGERWRSASPRLHQAYHLMTMLPAPILSFMEQRCAALVDDLSRQILTGCMNLRDSREHIARVFSLSQRMLMEIPFCQDDEDEEDNVVDVTDIIGEDRLLSFKAG